MISLLLLLANVAVGQDTIYYNKECKKVLSKQESNSMAVFSDDNDEHLKKSYDNHGNLRAVTSYNKSRKKKRLKLVRFYKSGEKYRLVNYEKNKQNGEVYTYWENGIVKRIERYKKGKFIDGNCWNNEGEEIEFTKFRIKPNFVGDNGEDVTKYFIRKVEIEEDESSGRIVIGFTVDATGGISNIKFMKRSYNRTLEAKVISALINMPKWSPGTVDGKSVSVDYKLPLSFGGER